MKQLFSLKSLKCLSRQHKPYSLPSDIQIQACFIFPNKIHFYIVFTGKLNSVLEKWH